MLPTKGNNHLISSNNIDPMLHLLGPFSHPEMSSEIGIYGLTAQGIQLALNMASKDCLVTVGNKSSDKVRSMLLSA